MDPNREEWCRAIVEVDCPSQKSAVLDVTDTLPMADSVADLMAMADHTIQEGNKEEKAETEEEIF